MPKDIVAMQIKHTDRELSKQLFGDFDHKTAMSMLSELLPEPVIIALADAIRQGSQTHGPGPVDIYRDDDLTVFNHIIHKFQSREKGIIRKKEHGNAFAMALAALQTLRLLGRDLKVAEFPPRKIP